jgi:hypothetical protein
MLQSRFSLEHATPLVLMAGSVLASRLQQPRSAIVMEKGKRKSFAFEIALAYREYMDMISTQRR